MKYIYYCQNCDKVYKVGALGKKINQKLFFNHLTDESNSIKMSSNKDIEKRWKIKMHFKKL